MTYALKTLDQSQIAAVMSTSNLNATQIAGALVSSDFTASQIASKLALMGFSEEATRAALGVNNFTKDEIEAAIASQTFTGATSAATIATGGFRSALSAIGTVAVAHPIMTAVTAIGALITIVTAAINIYNKFHKSTEELKEDYTNFENQLDDVTNQLTTTQSRISELRNLMSEGKITLVEKEELNNLQLQNAELERQIRLRQELAEAAGKELNDRLVEDYNKPQLTSISGRNAWVDVDAMYARNAEAFKIYQEHLSGVNADWDKLSDKQKATIEELYTEYSNAWNEAQYSSPPRTDLSRDEYINELIERYKYLNSLGGEMTSGQYQQMLDIRAELLEIENDIDTNFIDAYVGDGKDVKHWRDQVNAIDAAVNAAEHFESELQKLPDDVQKVLTDKGTTGNLTADNVSYLAIKYQELSDWMEESGYTAEDVAKHYDSLSKEMDNLANKRSAIKDAFGGKENFNSQAFSSYINGLNDKQIEVVYDLVINGKVDSIEEIKRAVEAAGLDDIISKDKLKEYQDIYNEYQDIVNEAKLLGVDLSNTIYGNIDTNNRQILEWTDENLEKYKDAIESWGMTVDELRGSYSTIFGSSDEFDGIEIAFTPIMQTKDGPVLLSQDTVYDYIDGLIEKAGDGWTNIDLFRLDTEGLDIDGVHIKNLLADIGDTAIQTGEAMHFTGDTGAVQEMFSALEKAAQDAGVSVETLLYYLDENKFQVKASTIKTVLSDLWNAEAFAETKTQIMAMAKSINGITPDGIEDLADECFELKDILDRDGMSAKFLAHILQTEINKEGSGFALITDEALALNDALTGISDQFNDITIAKQKYDEAMSVEEKDTNFKSYAEAFKELNDQFVAGTTNSNAFWAAAEYLFGEEQLDLWGWADGLDEIYNAMKDNADIFKDTDKAASGFLERLYEISDAGQIKAADGSVIGEIEKLSNGGFKFNFDGEKLDLLAEKLGMTSEMALSCMQMLSMYQDFQFYDVQEVMKTIKEIGFASDSLKGTAVNVGLLEEQLTALGYTSKDIHDLKDALQQQDGIVFLDIADDVNVLIDKIQDLGLAAKDGIEVKVNADALTDLMSNLNFTKDDAQELITKLSEVNNITLTDAQGKVITLNDALNKIDETEFASVTADIDEIKNSTDLAKKSVDELQVKLKTLKGKTITVTVRVNGDVDLINKLINQTSSSSSKSGGSTTTTITRKPSSRYSMVTNERGTNNSTGGIALVGEAGEELVQSKDRAYIVGENGPEIVTLKKGDKVYNAEQTKQIKNRNKTNSISGDIPAFEGGTINPNSPWKSLLPDDSSKKSSSSSKSSKSKSGATESVEDAISEFERLYKYHQHLMNMDQESVEEYIKWLDKAYKEAYENGEIELDDYYNYEEEVFEKIKSSLDDVRKEHENTITLTQNWLDNAIGEHDYAKITKYTGEIISHYKAMQDELHKQAEYYRSLGYSDTSDEVSELSDLWWDYYDEIKNVSADAWQQVVDDANNALDDIQGLYDTLKNAAQEYAESGFITVDTLQQICSWGLEYLAYLQNENGQLVINEASIQKVIAARTEQMAIESALNYVQQLRQALTEQDTVALMRLTTATTMAAQSTWDLVYAQLRLLGLNSEQYNNALDRVNALHSLTDITISGMGKVEGSIKEAEEAAKKAAEEAEKAAQEAAKAALESQKEVLEAAQDALEDQEDALDDLLKYVEDMIKQEIKNQVEALEDQVDKYKEIVDLQKQSLQLQREKDAYDKNIKSKTKEMEDIQKKIYMLDLDGSREAQAEKVKLQEELADIQEELAEEQADKAYDATVDMLDQMSDSYEKEKQKEIETLENSISSEEKLYQLA